MTSKQQVIMHRGISPTGVEWFHEARGDDSPHRSVVLGYTDWTEMGSPEVVTVTIEPGDLLNDDAS